MSKAFPPEFRRDGVAVGADLGPARRLTQLRRRRGADRDLAFSLAVAPGLRVNPAALGLPIALAARIRPQATHPARAAVFLRRR